MQKYLLASGVGLFLIFVGIVLSDSPIRNPNLPSQTKSSETITDAPQTIEQNSISLPDSPTQSLGNQFYEVIRVIDGDTIDIQIDGKIERLRLIGINTPETVDPRKPVECFGREASDKAKTLLVGKKVALESDPSQGERDKYSRLLRYVFLEDGTNFNLEMIATGYAYEYTYEGEYRYQSSFKSAQKSAEANNLGLWGANCASQTYVIPVDNIPNACNIKGNINSNKEKIYHVPGCGSYEKTTINESSGERWFCSEQEAIDAGWRKAKNC